MINRVLLQRLLLISAILLLVSAAGFWAAGNPRFAGGLVLGFILGAAPFASWAWILGRGLSTARNRILTGLLIVTKLGFYAGALYLFVTREIFSPFAVFIGLTSLVMIVGLGTLTARPKEAV